MRINLHHNAINSTEELKVIHFWAKEMCEDYNIGKQELMSGVRYFLSKEGAPEFSKWVKKNKNTKIAYWEFKEPDSESPFASGFDVEETVEVTKALLKN